MWSPFSLQGVVVGLGPHPARRLFLRGPVAAGAGCVLVGPADGGVHAGFPGDQSGRIGTVPIPPTARPLNLHAPRPEIISANSLAWSRLLKHAPDDGRSRAFPREGEVATATSS